MTILEVIQKSTAYLERHGVSSARWQAECLLAHVLQTQRLQLYLRFDQAVAEPALEQMRQLLRRRAAREPLQHLVGTVAFGDFELLTTPQALIPRPETELLLEHAARWLTARLAQPGAPPSPRLLDWGTGSGCLAIGLARQFPQAQVTALDLSSEALSLARQNAEKNGVGGRIHFLLSDGYAAVPSDSRFDLVVANPPYIPTAEIAQLEPEVREHDPRPALDGGTDGLLFYRRLARESPPYLAPGGTLWMELGHGQAAAVSQIFTAAGWQIMALEQDYQRIERVLAVNWPDTARGPLPQNA
ncbi:MAG: peptide chain release factor N(5)-glutamine methyltransferase [Verrucomicrobiae bacterium]|nr:peptide chain release factor N(5)-glutamine methyltransferase [Verrucomicrobiae bacterium]